MANTPREETSLIVTGVKKHTDGGYELWGCGKHPDEADLQSQFTERIFPIPVFSTNLCHIKGKTLAYSGFKFVGRYGLLGYRDLHREELSRRGEWCDGDPIVWALAHARIVAGVLEVIQMVNDVRSGRVRLDDHSAKAIADCLSRSFQKMGLEGPNKEAEPGAVAFTYLNPDSLGDRELRSTLFLYFWEQNPIGGAYELLAWLINPVI